VLGRDVFVWDVALQSKAVRCHPFAHPSDAAFSPDQRHLAVKSTSGQIVIIDAQSGQTAVDFKNTADGEGSNLQYSSCGAYIVDGSWSGRLAVRRAGSGAHEFAQEFAGEMIRSVHSSSDGKRWIIAHGCKATSHDRPPPPDYFSVWDWPFRPGGYRLLPERVAFARSSAVSPDGAVLAVVHGAPPDMVSVFRLSDGTCVGAVSIRSGAQAMLSVGRPMVGSSDQFKIKSWSSTHGQLLEGCMSWHWHIPAMWRSRHMAIFWPLVLGKLVGCSLPIRSPRRAFRRNPGAELTLGLGCEPAARAPTRIRHANCG